MGHLSRAGVDIERVKQDMDDPEIERRITQDMIDGAKLGIKQTPSFFVNGKPLMKYGAEPLKKLIERELYYAKR